MVHTQNGEAEGTVLIHFRVYGEPQAWPKKQYRMAGGRIVTYERDPKGLVKDWKEKILLMASEKALSIWFPRQTPLVMKCIFYRTRAKSNKSDMPVVAPDLDNYAYLVHNVLEKVLYDNDSQIVKTIDEKRWADEKNPPGVFICLDEPGKE